MPRLVSAVQPLVQTPRDFEKDLQSAAVAKTTSPGESPRTWVREGDEKLTLVSRSTTTTPPQCHRQQQHQQRDGEERTWTVSASSRAALSHRYAADVVLPRQRCYSHAAAANALDRPRQTARTCAVVDSDTAVVCISDGESDDEGKRVEASGGSPQVSQAAAKKRGRASCPTEQKSPRRSQAKRRTASLSSSRDVYEGGGARSSTGSSVLLISQPSFPQDSKRVAKSPREAKNTSVQRQTSMEDFLRPLSK